MTKQSDLRNLYIRLEELNEKINNNNEKLDLVIKILQNNVTKECKKMSEHIEFVENVYDAVKNPLGYICNTINSNTLLPEIEDKMPEIKDNTFNDNDNDNDNDNN